MTLLDSYAIGASHEAPTQMQRLGLPERRSSFGASQDEMDAELRRAGGAPRVNLVHSDTNAFPPPAGALDGFVAAASGDAVTCPPGRGDPGVRHDLAERLGRFLQRKIDPTEELILTPGTQGALFAALATTVQPGEPAVLFDPEYFGTEKVVRFMGGEVHHVPIRWWQPDPEPDWDRLADALRLNPRVMVFSNPNNPTGILFSRPVLERIAELLVELSPQTVVIADQLYARLVYDGGSFNDLAGLSGMTERCIGLFGPSKTESMTGYRIGVAVGPAALIDRMERLVSVMSLRAPAYSQHALAPWLRADEALVADRLKRFQELRDFTVETLESCERLLVRRPQGTAYVFPRLVGARVTEQEFAVILKKDTGILVSPGHQFGPGGQSHFRMCFAQDPERWEEILGQIIATVEAL